MYKEVSTSEKSTSFSYECLLDFNNEQTAAANRWSEVENKKKIGNWVRGERNSGYKKKKSKVRKNYKWTKLTKTFQVLLVLLVLSRAHTGVSSS